METENRTNTNEIENKEESPYATLITFIVLLPLFIWVGTSIYGEVTNDTSSATVESVPEVSRCLSVPDWITTRLNDGLNISGGSITDLQAVKSNDFGSVYFITGRLQGPGLGRDTDLATFISNRIGANESGMTFSADAVAVEFSDWPDIATTNLLGDGGVSRGVVISSDGYRESRECVSNS